MSNYPFPSDEIHIAAYDSSDNDKKTSDYICNGKDDQNIIEEAIDSFSCQSSEKARGFRIILHAGNYYISAFNKTNKYGHVAILLPAFTNTSFYHIGFSVVGSTNTENTTLHLTKDCYNSINSSDNYSFFGCESKNWNHYTFKDLYVTIPDSQKNIVCFDGRMMGSMGITRCKCLCDTRGNYQIVSKPLPVEGFIAFLGTLGSNNMWQEKWEFCQAEGFGQGFAVGSEHLLLHKCAALFGRYGFTFNNYEIDDGAVVHPMTLIGCIDEANANLWKFGHSNTKQCINAYNTSFEIFPEWFAQEGNFAKENSPGEYVGHIDYVINHGYYTENDKTAQFWESGMGINFETINNTHKKICTKEERLSYFPNYGQEIYDLTLSKKVICIDPQKKIWVDCMGNVVD